MSFLQKGDVLKGDFGRILAEYVAEYLLQYMYG